MELMFVIVSIGYKKLSVSVADLRKLAETFKQGSPEWISTCSHFRHVQFSCGTNVVQMVSLQAEGLEEKSNIIAQNLHEI